MSSTSTGNTALLHPERNAARIIRGSFSSTVWSSRTGRCISYAGLKLMLHPTPREEKHVHCAYRHGVCRKTALGMQRLLCGYNKPPLASTCILCARWRHVPICTLSHITDASCLTTCPAILVGL